MHNNAPDTAVIWDDLYNGPHFGVAASLPANTVRSFYHIVRLETTEQNLANLDSRHKGLFLK